MSRIYKKLLPEEQGEPAVLSAPDRPVLYLLPPPASARMLAPFFRKQRRKSRRVYTLVSLILIGAGFQYYHARSVGSPKPLAKALNQTEVKAAPVAKPALDLNQDLARGKDAYRLFKNQDYSAAKIRYEQLVENYPDSVEILNNLGMCYFKLNEIARAKKDVCEGIEVWSW